VAGDCCFDCCCDAKNPGEKCCKAPGKDGICCLPEYCCGTEEEPVCCNDETQFCCHTICCLKEETCCGTEEDPVCCAEGTVCCDGVCCDEGDCCKDGACEPCECEGDEDCPEGECCVGGVCLPCDPPPEPCEDDGDCPEGECCNEGECGECPCESDEDCLPVCPEGFTRLTNPGTGFAFCCPDGTFLGDDPNEPCEDEDGGTGFAQPDLPTECCDGVCVVSGLCDDPP
jgi:hypothetical protein